MRAVPVLLGDLHEAVADRRQGAIPEALTSILLHGPQVCLAFSLDWYSSKSAMICRIMLLMGSSPSSWVIETSSHAVLGEAADVELKLELIAEDLVLLELLRSRPAGYSPAGIWLGASM